jgi:hypothetical protein
MLHYKPAVLNAYLHNLKEHSDLNVEFSARMPAESRPITLCMNILTTSSFS